MSHRLRSGWGTGQVTASGARIVGQGVRTSTGEGKWSGGHRLCHLLPAPWPGPLSLQPILPGEPTPWPSISCRTGVRGRGLSNKVPCLPLATERAPDPTQTNRIPTPNPSPSSWKQEGRKEATPTFRLLLRLAMPPGSWGWSPPPTALATLKHPCPPL